MRAAPDAADAYSHYGAHWLAMRLRVNPVDCVAQLPFAELSPAWVQVDDRGDRIVSNGERRLEMVDHVRPAAQACPMFEPVLESDRA